MDTEHASKSELIEKLFEGILKELKSSLSKYSPSIFLVYAHNAKAKNAPKADADVAQKLIRYLKNNLELNLYSDMSPKKGASEIDILKSQLCLLSGKKDSVDRVILCGSKLLRTYVGEEEGSIYPEFEGYVNNALSFSSNVNPDIDANRVLTNLQSNLKDFEDRYPYEGFHHLMTEIAFLRQRKLKDKNSGKNTIIPVLLNGNRKTALPNFIDKWDIYIGDTRWRESKEWNEYTTFKNEGLYGGVFKLLIRLFDEEKLSSVRDFIQSKERSYAQGVKLIREGKIPAEKATTLLREINKNKKETQGANIQETEQLIRNGIKKEDDTTRTSQEDERAKCILNNYMKIVPRRQLNEYFCEHLPSHLTESNKANCEGINLSDENLQEADFSHANFKNAKLMRAYLRKVKLTETQLDGADITYAKELKSRQLAEAKFKVLQVTPNDFSNYKRVKKAKNLQKDKELKLMQEKISKYERFIELVCGYQGKTPEQILSEISEENLSKLASLMTPTFKDQIKKVFCQAQKREIVEESPGGAALC